MAKKKFFGCKIKGCRKVHFSKEFCQYHYGWLHKGWLNPDGTETGLAKPKAKYTNCQFPSCHRLKVHAKGLCVKHYKWLQKGNIDESLKVIKRPIKRYGPLAICVVPACENRPRRYGMCPKHSSSYMAGRIGKNGLPSDSYERKKTHVW